MEDAAKEEEEIDPLDAFMLEVQQVCYFLWYKFIIITTFHLIHLLYYIILINKFPGSAQSK